MFKNQYTSSGKGVAKESKKKSGFFLFFEIYSRKFRNLIKLNLIYFLFLIPVVVIGPATAAFFKILKNYTQEKNAFVWMDFWETFRNNLKQSLAAQFVMLIPAAGIGYGMYFYLHLAKEQTVYYYAFAFCILLACVLVVMNFYVYLMIISVDLPLAAIFKNALLLVFAGLKNSFFALVIPAVIYILYSMLLDMMPWLLILLPIGLISTTGFIVVFNCYPVIEKYVINPFYEAKNEDNPDYDYLKTGKESVFEDKGGKEKSVDLAPKHKGKVIR